MTEPERAIWARLTGYAFDHPDDTITFADKLVRETGWSYAFAERAIEEYRRYALLAVTVGHRVSPSDVVDQVWHAHLLRTRDYWDDFCPNVLGTTLHHEPNTGRPAQRDQLDDAYAQTLASYRAAFGDPPADIWPEKPVLARYKRVDLDRNFVLAKPAAIGIILLTVVLIVLMTLF